MLLLVGVAAGVVGAIVVDHRRAQAAADLAALAGARAATSGDAGSPCGQAATVAADNGARLTGCAVSGTEVVVDVLVEGPRWWGVVADLTASARAGPVGAG